MYEITELFWLLLPLSAASGWFAASMKKEGESDKPRIPVEYFIGLNMLLDQRHDNAVEVFIRLFEVDADTVETHIVLGNLFRQKGEIEKALRIHKNIIARPNLDKRHRGSALFEIGRDYFSAGLLDRAESFYRRAAAEKIGQVTIEVNRHLLLLYEIEKDWPKAIHMAESLENTGGEDYRQRAMHYHCEIAEEALKNNEVDGAEKHLRRARTLGGASLRCGALHGDLFFLNKNFQQALDCYVETFSKYPEYSHFLVPKIEMSMQKWRAEDSVDFLRKLDPKTLSSTYLESYFKALLIAGETFKAERFFSETLAKEKVSLALLRDFLRFKFRSNLLQEERETFVTALNCLEVILKKSFAFECSHCGFTSHSLYWRCPSCMYWDTLCPSDIFEE